MNITDIDWRFSTSESSWVSLLKDPTAGIDLAWGVGSDSYDNLIDSSALTVINEQTLIDYIEEALPNDFGGIETIKFDSGDNIEYFGSAISSFGFFANQNFLNNHNLPIPETWADLAKHDYYLSENKSVIGFLAPSQYLTTAHICQIILQEYGWVKGWDIITKMSGNAEIYAASIVVRDAVQSGSIGVGIITDSFGINYCSNCHYIIPYNSSSIMIEPLALGANVDDYNAAKAFIEYLLSAKGQSKIANWKIPILEEAFTITPYSTSVYSLYNQTKEYNTAPFDFSAEDSIKEIVNSYFHSTISSNHDLLRNTWGSLISKFNNSILSENYFNELGEDMTEVCISLEEATSLNEHFITYTATASVLENEWFNFAKDKYNEILNKLSTLTKKSKLHGFLLAFLIPLSIVIIRRRKKTCIK